MKTPLGSLDRIIIYSGNPIRCATFFRDHFGFPAIGEWSSDWAELDAGRCRLAFHQAYCPDGPSTSPTGSERDPHKLVIAVNDVQAARDRLIAQGVEISQIQVVRAADNLIACQGRDPEGHVYQICNK
jgi:Glyoxalase-like domain